MKKCFGEAFNLHYLCFLNYLVAGKVFFMKDLALITALNHLGYFCKLSFREKMKILCDSLGPSVLGKTVPSVLSADRKPRVQLFPIRTSRLVNNIYTSFENARLGFFFFFGNTVNREYMDPFPLPFGYLYARLTLLIY